MGGGGAESDGGVVGEEVGQDEMLYIGGEGEEG